MKAGIMTVSDHYGSWGFPVGVLHCNRPQLFITPNPSRGSILIVLNPDVQPLPSQTSNFLLVLQLGYLVGVPVTGYSLELGREHTEFAEAKIQVCVLITISTSQEA